LEVKRDAEPFADPLEPFARHCDHGGTRLPEGARFCAACSNPVPA
jgi:hypothetical protein